MLLFNCSPCQLRESVTWNNFAKNNFEMCFKILDIFHTLNSTIIPLPKNYLLLLPLTAKILENKSHSLCLMRNHFSYLVRCLLFVSLYIPKEKKVLFYLELGPLHPE